MLLMILSALIIWLAILALPWRPWSTREQLNAATEAGGDLSDVTVLIPARNEADLITSTLHALSRQGTGLRVVLIDDESTDGTADRARAAGTAGLSIITGTPPPNGWSGKLWALEQGRACAHTDLILLLDADITLAPNLIGTLKHKLASEQRAFVSLMVELRMKGFWERLLLPAFVYFFKLLYPFALANSQKPWIAAAAGGCILIRCTVLEEIGGFEALKDALIDDCALARLVKSRGHRTWLGLTRSAHSQRRYADLASVWNMVARTAFTQLRYSTVLLLLCTLLMTAAFWAPPLGLLSDSLPLRLAAVFACTAMMASYLPTLRFYAVPSVWCLSLPLSATLYLAMTWASAWRYWRGERSRWKGRSYRRGHA